jgi:hypothetical protein
MADDTDAPIDRPNAADAGVGHNGGPPIEEPVDRYILHAWTVAHREVWKNPPLDILRFRVARAEAAGVSYHEYMLELLDTGRHLQAKPKPSSALKPRPRPTGSPTHGAQPTGPTPVSSKSQATPVGPHPAQPAPQQPDMRSRGMKR